MQFHEQIWMMAFSLPIPSISYEVWQGAKKINFNQKLQARKKFSSFFQYVLLLYAPRLILLLSDYVSDWLQLSICISLHGCVDYG